MKATILLSLCSAMISGCATEHSALTSSGRDMADEVKAKGLADHYNMTSDVDPSEYDALDRHQRNQSFGKGCRLDFHTLMQATPPQRGWQLRDGSSNSAHPVTFRRFVSDTSFRQGKHDIPEPLAADLAWFAREFNRSPLMPFVLVVGHTNSDGSASYNQALSEKRADEVYRFLISQGIPATHLQKFGVGETSPFNDLDSEQATLRSRRVEIVTFIPSNIERGQSHCGSASDLTVSKANMESSQ